MGDIYVVSGGARERLLAAAEQDEDRYVVRAGLEQALFDASVRDERLAPFDPRSRRESETVVVPSRSGRE